MKIPWMLVFCIALTIARTQCAAVSTTETLVVAKTDDEVSPTPSSSDEVTEEPNAPIKLTEMLVRSEVTMRYAHTTVITHVRNPASKAQEATFHVLLPDTAFISGFIMTLGGKSYKAYIKEKNEAKKVYKDAVSHGTGAAHIAAKARDSNHFTVSVNVEPKSVAIFNLTYEEMLVRRNGVYNHAINLHPGTLVPKLEVVVHIKESQKITTLRVPEVRTGNEIDATDNDGQNSKAVLSRNGDQEATITFTPDMEEQMRLVRIYKDKTRDSATHSHNSELDQQEDQGLLGQFVVQYDVDHSNYGEILVNDGYFVHFLAPNTLPTLSKHVVFVLDTSGSMSGRKMEQLKAAMDAILSNLNPNDYFNIVEFNTDFSVHQLKNADEPSRTQRYYTMQYDKELVTPAIASPENIAKAKIIISRLQATGITNIYSALNVAIDLIHKFANDNKAAKNINKTNSTDAREDQDNKIIINEREPIIIFLTDGEANTGETVTSRIISQITEKNNGELKASLYSLAFGEDADRNFLRKLSLRNEGFMRHIYEAADAALQLRDFYRQVSSPLLAHVKFTYPKDQVKEGTVSKNQFRMVYAGSEIVVAGELADQTSELAPSISAFRGAEDGAWMPYEMRPKVPVSHAKHDFFPLERLWAYLSIKQLLDQRDAAEQPDEELEKKALALALKYSFVTSLTSLVVVKPNETNAVDAEPADKKDPQQNIYQQLPHYGVSRHSNYQPISDYGTAKSYSSSRTHNRILGGYRGHTMNIGNGMRNKNYIGLRNRGHWYDSDEQDEDYGDPQQNIYQQLPHYGVSRHSNYQPISDYGTANSYSSSRTHNRILGGYRGHTMNIGNRMRNRNYIGLRNRGHWYDSDEQDEDYGDNTSFQLSPQTPSAATTTQLSVTTEVPDEKKYHLENYSWALGLLNNSADALVFSENETQIILELSKDINVPRSSGPEEACSNTISSQPGPATCVYLTRCASAKNITVDEYRKSYCRVVNKYAGVCCPSSEIDAA